MNATLTLIPPNWMSPTVITNESCDNLNAHFDELGENCDTPCLISARPSYDMMGPSIQLEVDLEDLDPGLIQEAIECVQEALMMEFDTRFE